MADQRRGKEGSKAIGEDPLAVIVMNYRRPRNIDTICQTVLGALSEAVVFLLDQADDESCTVQDSVPPGVWYQRAANAGCIARLTLAAALPFQRYLAIDDDLFLTRTQLRQLAAHQQIAPDRVHGIWGQRVLVHGKRLRVHNAIFNQNAEVSILNQVYAFSRAQAVGALELIQTTGFDREEMRNCDDILLSSAGERAPMCHDLGPLAVCQTYNEVGVAIGTERSLHETRARLIVSLLELGKLHNFPSGGP